MENKNPLCLLYSINIIVSLCFCRKITNKLLSAKFFTHFLYFHPILRLTLRHWYALPFTDAGTQVRTYAGMHVHLYQRQPRAREPPALVFRVFRVFRCSPPPRMFSSAIRHTGTRRPLFISRLRRYSPNFSATNERPTCTPPLFLVPLHMRTNAPAQGDVSTHSRGSAYTTRRQNVRSPQHLTTT